MLSLEERVLEYTFSLHQVNMHSKVRVKSGLRDYVTYVVALRMRSVVRHLHDVCAVHIRRNSVQCSLLEIACGLMVRA